MNPKKILALLFSTSASGLYILLFATSIGVATFIENDFGTSAAQKVVYRAKWFEVLLLLFALSILVNIIRYRMVQQRKWAIFTFHAATLIILLGAGITRYFGSEGMMRIREGSATHEILSDATFLQFTIESGGQKYRFDEEVFFTSLGRNRFQQTYQLGADVYAIKVLEFIPNPVTQIREDPTGIPMVKIVMGDDGRRKEYWLAQEDLLTSHNLTFNFSQTARPGMINIAYQKDSLWVKSAQPIIQMVMANQQMDTLAAGRWHPLLLRSLYTTWKGSFVVSDFTEQGKLAFSSSSHKMSNRSVGMVKLEISKDRKSSILHLKGGKGMLGEPQSTRIGNARIKATYGAKYVDLPFSLFLRDFIMERYPGTNSASSYASEVTLVDPRNGLEKEKRIFMNNILNYDGYRFFQSSYDQDEKGTILSVNHDMLGTKISYLGYFLLTLGMILTLVSKKSRFYFLSQKLRKIRSKRKLAGASMMVGLVMLCLPFLQAQSYASDTLVIDARHSEKFAALVVQDHKGRMKPIHTMASELLRKISRKETMYGQTPMQILLGMLVHPQHWMDIPLIKVGRHEELHDIINVEGQWAAYNDFFDDYYLLRDHVQEAYNLKPQDRGTFEKELIRVDERVNIVHMMCMGHLMKIFPLPHDQNNRWQSPPEVSPHHAGENMFASFFFPNYVSAARNNQWQEADQMIDDLCEFQQKHGGHILPPADKVKAEILLNEMNVFGRVGRYYGLMGLLTLMLFFLLVFKPSRSPVWPLRVCLTLLAIVFILHTAGLALRWYVAGRAPWSNGYESMIYIGWTTMLAGLIFTRKSLGGLAATSILASTILMVAGLSWMDPEITPLVPVLRSYWLTIHVSLEAGSYGFLMLGAIIGVLNLILMCLANPKNQRQIKDTIQEMSIISEMTLIAGLFMISVGTYLGGVWANESWGRYWGWDAKETWALVTILIYAFILHMRFIPGLRSLYAFNVATLFGLASVMMTYFGVNYYLSGLHSYAAGDPAPIPSFVYYIVLILTVISILAAWRNRQNKLAISQDLTG